MSDLMQFGLDAEEIVQGAWTEAFEPPPDITVSQWADRHRILSGKASAEPGQWKTSRVPYAREPMDMLSPQSPAERIVLMWPSQSAKTESGNNWIGYIIHHAPAPTLFVMPSLLDLKKNVLQRINPMIEETPALRERVAAPRSRDAANNMFVKEFHGGMLLFSTANSASALASMPICYLYCDEIDRYPHNIDGEGDPVELAIRRTITFRGRRKILLTSTPTIKGFSRIEREFNKSDKRRYFVPCPHCGHMQYLRWKDEDGSFRLVWDKDRDGNHLPETARYLCEGCGVLIEEKHKRWMLDEANGARWIATAAGDGRTIGYHLNGLYSPFMTWEEIVREFLAKKDYIETLQEWTNTVLAEPFEDAGLSLNANTLGARLESWPRLHVPADVAVLVGAVDVQGDRLECKIVGYGAGEESWLIDYEIIWGSPSSDATVWEQLDEWRHRELIHAGSGKPMRLSILLIDSSDETDAVYDYVRPRQNERVYAIKGKDYLSRPGLAMESMSKRNPIKFYLLATIAAKDRIFARLRIPPPVAGQKAAPGYMHIPDWIPEQYLDQLTAEKKMVTKNPRTGALKVHYEKTGRNEALDLEVYCLCALFILQNFINPALYRDLARLHEMLIQGLAPAPRARRMRSSGINR